MGLWVASTLSGATTRAIAHPESQPGLTNRYVTLAAHGDRVEVSVALLFGELPGMDLRRQADADGNGRLSPEELEVLRRKLTALAADWLELEVNGEPRPFTPTVALDLGGKNAVEADAVVVEARDILTQPPSRLAVTLIPKTPPPRLGETEITAALGDGWRLTESRGPQGGGQDRSFKTNGPTRFVASFRLDRTNTRETVVPTGPRAVFSVLLAAGMAFGAWILSRRRWRRGAKP